VPILRVRNAVLNAHARSRSCGFPSWSICRAANGTTRGRFFARPSRSARLCLNDRSRPRQYRAEVSLLRQHCGAASRSARGSHRINARSMFRVRGCGGSHTVVPRGRTGADASRVSERPVLVQAWRSCVRPTCTRDERSPLDDGEMETAGTPTSKQSATLPMCSLSRKSDQVTHRRTARLPR